MEWGFLEVGGLGCRGSTNGWCQHANPSDPRNDVCYKHGNKQHGVTELPAETVNTRPKLDKNERGNDVDAVSTNKGLICRPCEGGWKQRMCSHKSLVIKHCHVML